MRQRTRWMIARPAGSTRQPRFRSAAGMHGKKVTKGLYADLAGGPEGWVEVCSDEFFEAMGTPGDIGKKNCGNSKALLAGCLWDDVKNACVYGLKKMIHCSIRYKDDDKL